MPDERTVDHLIVHQFDPASHIAGGVHGFIVDLIRLAPPGHRFRLVGVDAVGERRLGAWITESVGSRDVLFMPVARLNAAAGRRFPHTARLVGGLLARRPRNSFEFVHAHRAETGLALSLLYPGTPLVQFVHTDSAEALRHRAESFWRYLPRTNLAAESAAVRRAAVAWVFNAEAARRLRHASSTVRPGRNWYDDTVFCPETGSPSRPLTVGWIGRLEASKDPARAVATFAELAKSELPVRCWIAGSGTLESDLRREIESCGLASHVRLLGTVSPPRVAELLAETDVLLVTSLWEGQPRAVLEALGCGVPVVSTDVGDVPALVLEGVSGYVSATGAPHDLAQLVLAAAALRDAATIAATVAQHRASRVVGELFGDLEELRGRAAPRPHRRAMT
jgi:glycosyltransferase involved in cell wall biosynthesis